MGKTAINPGVTLKKFGFLSILLICGQISFAKMSTGLTCVFTEPFIEINIQNLKTAPWYELGALVYFQDQRDGNSSLTGNITSSDFKLGTHHLRFSGAELGTYLLKINTDEKGSDGMSDKVYNYNAVLESEYGHQIVVGGCDLQ
jgi:hypothetical protein